MDPLFACSAYWEQSPQILTQSSPDELDSIRRERWFLSYTVTRLLLGLVWDNLGPFAINAIDQEKILLVEQQTRQR